MFALHYSPVKTPAEEGKIFGLQVAILDWVKAYFRYGTQQQFHVLIGDVAGQEEVAQAAAEVGLDPARLVMADQRFPRENFGQYDIIFRADPDPKNLFWQRQQITGKRFAFCGLAHAVTGVEGGSVLEQYCLAPTTGADAIVCPSHAVAAAVRSFWDRYADYIRAHFGGSYRCPVQLPVTPLGIDIEKFAHKVTPEKRASQRDALGIGADDTVLLWVGRLSHAIKAHPLAMYQAAERAAELTGETVHLVMQGYFVPPEAEAQFIKLAEDVCAKVKVHFVASNDPRFPDGLWACGDIFFSLIDNMQESFGLTPIEAMAAGLPRVVSDWDGYKDSVRNGEDGFLIRTATPPAGAGQALSDQLLNGREMYGGFLAKAALCSVVDQDMAAAALKLLIEDKDKRRSMVEKARMRAKALYDWRYIIPAYEALWRNMADRRMPNGTSQTWPTVPDPFAMFAGYPSAPLKEGDQLHVAASIDVIRMLLGHDLNALGLDVMIPPEELMKLITFVSAHGGIKIGDLLHQFQVSDSASLWRSVAWMLKLGIFRRS